MSDELPGAIQSALARPDVWDEPGPGLEDDIVAAVRSEIRTEPVPIDRARRPRRLTGWVVGAAAVAVIALAAALIANRAGDDDEVAEDTTTATLDGTQLAPEATATAFFTPTPAGLKILLDVEGLPGAGPDEMYEAWITDGSVRVSAGTFHLRGGDDPIELWAGTDDPRFQIISVTIEPIDDDAGSSRNVVLTGGYDLAGDDDDSQYEPD